MKRRRSSSFSECTPFFRRAVRVDGAAQVLRDRCREALEKDVTEAKLHRTQMEVGLAGEQSNNRPAGERNGWYEASARSRDQGQDDLAHQEPSVPSLTKDSQIGTDLRVCADEENRADFDRRSGS
jgi:hypothetical protein